jgi:putative Mn2+ efflux pump MntP
MDFGVARLLVAAMACGIYQNIDNFALAAAYRIKNVVIPPRANLLIAILSGMASGGAVALGCMLEEKARDCIGDALKNFSCGILIMIGIWMLVCYFRSRLFPQLGGPAAEEQPLHTASRTMPAPMRNREALVVAIALAADNLAPSFLGGLSGTLGGNPVLTGILLVAFTGFCSFAAVAQGQAMGRQGRLRLRHVAPELLSGCMVIGIAVLGLVEDSNPLSPQAWFAGNPDSTAEAVRSTGH